MDHVHECLKRRFPCVNQAEAKKIKMNRARNMPLGKLFRRPHIDQTEVRCAEFFLQFSRCCEERFSRVFFFHIAPITLLKMTLQIMRSRTSLRALLTGAWRFPLLVLFLTLSLPGRGEGEGSFTYKLALPGRKISLPADHYSHPDFKIEWWYYTGHLESESGKRYGYQVTFFRFGVRDRQKEVKEPPLFTELYMAHFALSDIQAKKFIFRERINRGIAGKAGAATDRYSVWNEDWRVEGTDRNHSIHVNDRGTRLQLQLKSLKPPALHGKNGLSQKGEGEGRASYYYSLTRMETEGELTN